MEPGFGNRLQLVDGSAGNPHEQQAGEFLSSEDQVLVERVDRGRDVVEQIRSVLADDIDELNPLRV